jgi:hypothetical protein
VALRQNQRRGSVSTESAHLRDCLHCDLAVHEAFAACTWAEILAPMGWCRTQVTGEGLSRIEIWRRPSTVGASWLAAYGNGRARCRTIHGLTSPGWSKFRTWAELGHGGDLHGARLAVRAAGEAAWQKRNRTK